MLSWIVWLDSDAWVMGDVILPFSNASYDSAMASPDTPRSAPSIPQQ